jgi:hypothetical protein
VFHHHNNDKKKSCLIKKKHKNIPLNHVVEVEVVHVPLLPLVLDLQLLVVVAVLVKDYDVVKINVVAILDQDPDLVVHYPLRHPWTFKLP